MGKIRSLPKELISVISSGQIASSPRAVLKELLENALDSQPTKIKVEIGNPFNFKVVDDGCGIEYEELPLAVERFTTSKVSSLEELKNLKTYGFRGEALYAISQFSKLTIKSRTRGSRVGGELVVRGGEIVSHSPVPFSCGTSVSVEELFFNATLRKSRVPRAERAAMVRLAKIYAIARPDVEFSIDGRSFPISSLQERLHQITGRRYQRLSSERATLFFSKEERGIKQLFVNGRPVSIPEIEKLLEGESLTSYALFLEVEPRLVDFNVSPTKERVLIGDETLFKEVEELLRSEFRLPSVLVFKDSSGEIENSYAVPLRLIGSDGTFLIAHDGESYYFFDQHLVHERVNYEKLLKMLREGKIPTSRLHPPIFLPQGLEEELKNLGVKFYRDREELVVYEIPKVLSPSEVLSLKSGENSLESLATLACKRAIKAGYLPKESGQIEELFSEYLKCENRESCPHGRPIYYKISKRQILSRVGRRKRQ